MKGIGVDIVQVSRISNLLEKYGERFAKKILSTAEYEEFLTEKYPAVFLAKRFAAKEATVKALGTGFTQGIWFSDVEVSHDPHGKPILIFHNQALAWFCEKGFNDALISLADEVDYAIAFVTLV